jgi:surfeit locus 1 family protein
LSRRTISFVVFAFAVAAGCVRLGFWQLDRLHQRRERNAEISQRLALPPAPAREILRGSGNLGFRRASATGTYDYEHEVVLALRTHEGSPGVNILTPLRLPGSDTALLVNRGWVYSPDGLNVDPTRWRERSDAAIEGYLQSYSSGEPGPARASLKTGAVRRLEHDSLATNLPYPLAPYYFVVQQPAVRADSTPVRLTIPPLDEGPHLGYAIQWFSFALIAVVGAGFVARKK